SNPDADNAPLLPVVAETYDDYLNDILNSFNPDPSKRVDFGMAAKDAISNATTDTPAQGNVGGGTGMTCYSWKGGIGTSSRVVQLSGVDTPYRIGVLVQANQGTLN